jgi:signal transduction histidine kinase
MHKPLDPDYFALLFAVLSMQIMQRFDPKPASLWIGLFSIAMFVPLIRLYPSARAVPFTIVYTAVCVLTAAYSLAARRAVRARTRSQSLADELHRTNHELAIYANRLERLAISTERNRLARELHDSVTQTVFSMTLTTQSAMMLLESDPGQVKDQLNRLYQLSRSATSEMQTLISELRPESFAEGGLPEAIRRHLADGHLPESLSVNLVVEGDEQLDENESMGLFRIVQEALNNVVKHGDTDNAQIRIHLDEPAWVEIEDHGRGFDLDDEKGGRGIGLAGMKERVLEIGWQLQITSAPGKGTRVRVERRAPGGEVHDGERRAN